MGTASGGLTIVHADGTPYGPVSPANVDVLAKAQRALVELGFRESETKRALAHVPLHPDMTLEWLVRQTLCELAPNRH
jgi:Holliday junction resolvasome RuvABC DNA-binding subunit